MRPDEWAAEFARRGETFRAERLAFHRAVAARIAAEAAAEHVVAPVPVVLEPGHEVDRADVVVPDNARRLFDLALSCGWAARLVASTGAHPVKGLLVVVTLRVARHDERGYGAWWNRAWESGWFIGSDGLERLAGTAMTSRKDPKDGTAKIRGIRDVIEGLRLTRH